ncbi:MAG: sarcosine oxidase subunit gamma family protein [Pseudomonadota bacterium]
MSNAVSVAGGESFGGVIQVADAGVTGMVTVRGDLASAAMKKAVKAATGLAVPAARQVTQKDDAAVAWMSPDELMIICAYDSADKMVAALEKSLGNAHALAVNVSDARAHFTLTGAAVREVLAKGSPADLAPAALPVGEMRRTRLGQIAVAFWLPEEGQAELICFRSVGKFVWDWLNVTAKDDVPGYF